MSEMSGWCVILIMSAMLCLSGSASLQQHTNQRRGSNICEICREMVSDAVLAALADLRDTTRCFEVTRNYDALEAFHQSTTEEDLLYMVPEFRANLDVLTNAWRRYPNTNCLGNNLKRHLNKLSCLLKTSRQHDHQCNILPSIAMPSGFTSTVNATAYFLRNVTGTLLGFLGI